METPKPQTQHKDADKLSLRLFGEIRVQRGGRPVALPASKRTRALLGYLAATGTAQTRQALCDLLWDGPDDPRAALRWSLTKLRPIVNDARFERLAADRERVAFSLDHADIDIVKLGRLLPKDVASASLAQLEDAAPLLRGEFLDGLDLPSCFRFHHWCLAERERWGIFRRRVLAVLVERLQEEPERGLPHARELVSADPLSEASHGRLVALLASLGRRKEAQDHYDYARELLRREMGAPLNGELKPPSIHRPSEVNGGGKAGKVDKKPSYVAEPVKALPHEPLGLIGRVAEREAIATAIDALVAGALPQALLFLGVPGIGKSQLLQTAMQTGEQKGARTMPTRCFEAEAVRPYGCWADVLGPLIEQCDASLRSELALFSLAHAPPNDSEINQTRTFAAVSKLLSAAADDRPLILIIDDLQWIDEASSVLLHYLLRPSNRPARFLFLGAARADEIDDNPWCKRVLESLAREGSITHINIGPLNSDEAVQFFSETADRADVATAIAESGGNPLFLKELARVGLDRTGQDLDALITNRIGRLESADRDLIVFASATARDFKPELLGAAMGVPEPQLLGRIERLERRGLLKPSRDGRFDFAHDLIRQATYRGLSQPRRRLIHRQIALALEETARQDQTLAGELAYHAGAAGDHALAVRACIAAGEHCLRVFANTAALDAADRGLGHLAQLPAGAGRTQSHVALLKIKVFASASPGFRPLPILLDQLQQVMEAAELMRLDSEAALCSHLISWATQRSNDTQGAASAILQAERISRSADDLTHCQQLANTGRCLLEVETDVADARAFLVDAGRLAASLKQNFVELDWGRGLIARWDGDLAGANALMQRALALARLREDRWREIECLIWIAKIDLERGALNEVNARCDEIDGVAARIGDGRSPVADALRVVAAMQSSEQGSDADLHQSVEALRALDDKAQLAYILNQIADVELSRRRFGAAHLAATEALGAAQAVRRTTEIIVASCLVARALAGLGEAGRAADILAPLTAGESSARARLHLDRARMSLKIPTLPQTEAT